MRPDLAEHKSAGVFIRSLFRIHRVGGATLLNADLHVGQVHRLPCKVNWPTVRLYYTPAVTLAMGHYMQGVTSLMLFDRLASQGGMLRGMACCGVGARL